MSQTYQVPAELREDVGKGASRRLRRQKKVPAVVYGESRDPVALTLDHDYILHATEEESFHASVLELKVGDGRKQKVILRDLQRHPFKPTILHVDFQRISEKNELRIEVPLHYVNEEISPAGKQGGIVISYMYTELEISALPKDLPEYIEVDLVNLDPGERMMMSQLRVARRRHHPGAGARRRLRRRTGQRDLHPRGSGFRRTCRGSRCRAGRRRRA